MIPPLKLFPVKIFLGLAGLLAACGCGNPVQETAAHKIADALPAALGPAARYDVQVDGDPLALSRGRARAVHLQGRDVRLSPSLTLDTLDADVRDVSFDAKTRRLSHVGGTAFRATLSQANLDRYLASSKPRLPGLVISLLPDQVAAQIPVSFLGVRSVAALSGTLSPNPADPQKLDFRTRGAQVGSLPLPAGLVNLAVSALNPVVDLSGLQAPLTVSEAHVVGSRLTLSGTADLTGLVPR